MTDSKLAAKRYLSEGWTVIPIPRGEKGPRLADWQNRTFDESDFQSLDNVGVRLGEPSGNLVDVDIDDAIALDIAAQLLLITSRIHGRKGKPRSHYWYTAKGLKSEKFEDIDNSMIIEIRANATQQTVLPPSLHAKSGDVLEWEVDRAPKDVDAAALRRSVVMTATASILAKHWPGSGQRHEAAGLMAGLLAVLKLEAVEIEQIIIAAATAAKDDDIADRARYARDTVARMAGGQPVAGGPKLSDIIGLEVVKRIRKWFGGSGGDSRLDELNERHAVIFQQSGDLCIITEDRDGDSRPFLRFSSPEVIKQLYPQPVQVGTSARGTPIIKPLGQVWLTSPKRRFYNGIELAPNGRTTPGYYNMWRGFAVEPKKGSWLNFEEHIRKIVCNQNEEIFKYVISWMAKAIQKPGQPANTAIALRGGQGTGKGAFVRGFGALFGVHFIHLDSTRHLTGNFNAHLHNAILVFADEAAWPGDKAGLGALKRLVTEPTLSIERKGMDIFTVPNMIHLLLASNEDWVVPAAIDERRFVVLDVDKSRQCDTKYFATIEDELYKQEGLSAMLYDLLNYKIDVDLRIIPKTDALLQQKQIGSGAQRRWWFQILQDGDFWRKEVPGEPGNFRIDRVAIYDNYVNTLDRAGQRVKSIQTELGTFLKKVMPNPYPGTYRARSQSGWEPREWTFPSLEVCRKHYDDEYGIVNSAHWPAIHNDMFDEPSGLL